MGIKQNNPKNNIIIHVFISLGPSFPPYVLRLALGCVQRMRWKASWVQRIHVVGYKHKRVFTIFVLCFSGKEIWYFKTLQNFVSVGYFLLG